MPLLLLSLFCPRGVKIGQITPFLLLYKVGETLIMAGGRATTAAADQSSDDDGVLVQKQTMKTGSALDLLVLSFNCAATLIDVPVFAGHLQTALARNASELPEVVVL